MKAWIARCLSYSRSRLSSLQLALVISVVAGIALPTVYSVHADRQHYEEQLMDRQHEDMVQIGGLLALSLREPVWQVAPDIARSILEASLVDKRILAIEVLDSEGQLFVESRRHDPRLFDHHVVTYAESIWRGQMQLGTLIIQLSSASYHQQLEDLLDNQIRRSVTTVAAAVLLTLVLLRLRLVRPVARLVKASAALAAGDLQTPVRSERSDELGQLAHSLDETRLALARLFRELEQRNADLAVLNNELESRVQQRTAELEQALASLRKAQKEAVEAERLASLGRIVAGVAHELNTPIGNALTVASSLDDLLQPVLRESREGALRRSTLGRLTEAGDEGLGILIRNLERAAGLIRDFKQVAVDQTSEQRRVFDPAVVTEEVLATLRPTLRAYPHQLCTFLDPGLRCDSYPGPYGQVLTHLVLNALVHAFPEGRVGNVTIRVQARGVEGLSLWVEDDGVGMDEAVRHHIFDPFFTTSLGQGRSGLGMNVVQGYVTRVLGGRVTVLSHLGEGTRVLVEIPRTAPNKPVDESDPGS